MVQLRGNQVNQGKQDNQNNQGGQVSYQAFKTHKYYWDLFNWFDMLHFLILNGYERKR